MRSCSLSIRLASLIALATTAGCTPTEDPAPARDTPSARQQAVAARDALAGELQLALGEAIARGGPEAGIAVCEQRAPAIAREVAARFGVGIGRTSARLRNPDNEAPPWARPLPEGDDERHVALPDGGDGFLFPIRLAPLCVNCHGPRDLLRPSVRDTLADHYPEDRAVGYAAGDLRGWFWVEVR